MIKPSTHLVGVLLAFGSLAVYADNCHLQISGNDAMQFDQRKLVAPSNCTEIELTLTHTGKAPANVMGHNWVLTKTADVAAVANAGAAAGFTKNFQAAGDARILAATKIVGGGESTTIKFSSAALRSGDDYTFFCSSPGHWSVMKGKLLFGDPKDRLASEHR
jgi:azurin